MLRCSCCGKAGLDGEHGVQIHVGKSPFCNGARGIDARQALAQQTAASMVDAGSKDQAERVRIEQYKVETHAAMLDRLQEQRFGKLRDATQIAQQKDLVVAAVDQIKPEIFRRVKPLLDDSATDLSAIVAQVCDVFGQLPDKKGGDYNIYSEKSEMRAHERSFGTARVYAQERTLGWLELRSTDAEGVGHGRSRVQRRFCHDVPVDATLRRLLQTDVRARRQVQEASARWART
jgi:hypothetical protein